MDKREVDVSELGPPGSGEARKFLMGPDRVSGRLLLAIGLVIAAAAALSRFIR